MISNFANLRVSSQMYQCLCRNVKSSGVLKKAHNRRNRSSLVGKIQPEEQEQITISNQFDHLSRVITPLWQMPYDDQLKQKFRWTCEVVHGIGMKIRSQIKQKRAPVVQPKIYRVMPSPVTMEYRNKDEFSVHFGIDGNPKTVGFFVGSTASKNVVCVPPTHLVNVKQKHKELAHHFEEYIQASELPTCTDLGPGGGNWRGLVVRSNEAGRVLAVALCHPQSLPPERLLEEQENLKDFFVSGPGKDCCPSSLYFQACNHTRCTNEQAPFILLHGEPYLTEELSGNTFRISPDAFFQVNTKASEMLYETVLRQAGLTPMTTLLDVCCGTGTISILAADHVRGCVGIESIKDAVRDAKYNAKANSKTNVDFFSGLAEKKIGKILQLLDMSSDIVAVVNPGRAGLGPKVLQALNKCPQIARVVYISCKADMPSTCKNFVQLYTEGNFRLKSVVPVDLFPHTLHTELVMTFCR